MSQNSPTLQRIRLTYAREQALRYTSHLDMQMVWERTFRRARLPIAYTQGFNPRPRLHLACALPLGFLSRCELVDVWFDNAPNPLLLPVEVLNRTQASAPPGLVILAADEISLNSPALQTLVTTAEYQAQPLDALDNDELDRSTRALMQSPLLERQRRGKSYDLRPLIEGLEVRTSQQCPILWMSLSARESATGRPEEVLDALGLDPSAFRIERTRLVLKNAS